MSWNDIFVKKKTEEIVEVYDVPTPEAGNAESAPAGQNEDFSETENAEIKIPDIPSEESGGGSGPLCDMPLRMYLDGMGDAGKAAVYLALSDDIGEEGRIKDALSAIGWHGVATEVGGISGDLSLKVSRALVGAALNSGVVHKSTPEMHALMHAAQEAFSSFIPPGLLQTSIGAKIAIVRNAQWIAVAVAGDTAFHATAHHARVGLGVMHI